MLSAGGGGGGGASGALYTQGALRGEWKKKEKEWAPCLHTLCAFYGRMWLCFMCVRTSTNVPTLVQSPRCQADDPVFLMPYEATRRFATLVAMVRGSRLLRSSMLPLGDKEPTTDGCRTPVASTDC